MCNSGITVYLSPEAARLVQRAVSSGEYPSAEAVVEAAVHELSAQGRTSLGYSIDELRRLGDEGEASGPGHPFDLEGIKREVRRGPGAPNEKA